jgi:hypothetical protein
MHKLAIFVEGYTELCFVDRLIAEIANANHLAVEHMKISGGSTVPRRMKRIKAANLTTQTKFFVLIYNCEGDKQVKTRIQEEHASLSKSDYQKIIGIRDVKPIARADIPKLEWGLRGGIKTSLIPVEFILSIMEIEAWFLSEFTHFPRIDPLIDVASISANLGFNPQTDDMSQRIDPLADMTNCYLIAGKKYSKGNALTTVNALDMDKVYFNLRTTIPYLNTFLNSIDGFLSS